jgi:hypothetical protein
VKLTQPICRLSRSSGSKRWPMMNSVLPPPMSATRRLPGVSARVWKPQVDQARFFTAGDDLDRVAENGFGAQDEFAVARFAQGVGADDAHGAGRHAVDQLGEALEAIQAPLHGFFAELALFVDAGSQLNLSPSRSRMRISCGGPWPRPYGSCWSPGRWRRSETGSSRWYAAWSGVLGR